MWQQNAAFPTAVKKNEGPLWAVTQKTPGLGGSQQQWLLYLCLLFLYSDGDEEMTLFLVEQK